MARLLVAIQEFQVNLQYSVEESGNRRATMNHDSTNEADAIACERKRDYLAQLAAAPVEDIVGLVNAEGPGGWPDTGDLWTLSFHFHCWKLPSGPIKHQPLSVSITTTQEEYNSLWKQVSSYSVVRIRARLVEESVFGTPAAQLMDFLGLDNSDPEMNQAEFDLQQPVIHHDAQFGQFTLDRRVNWYTAEVDWCGSPVSLQLTLDDSETLIPALQNARSLWGKQQEWAKRIENYAVEGLLPLKNELWLEEGEAEVSVDDFKARMTLESVTIAPDGSFDFWHDDGDLFFGHSIMVRGNLSDGPTKADIPG